MGTRIDTYNIANRRVPMRVLVLCLSVAAMLGFSACEAQSENQNVNTSVSTTKSQNTSTRVKTVSIRVEGMTKVQGIT